MTVKAGSGFVWIDQNAEQFRQVVRMLNRRFPDRVRDTIYLQALRKAGKILVSKAKSKAPVRTGLLKKAIRFRAKRRSKKIDSPFGVLTIGKGAYRGDTFYASFLHYGYHRGKRGSSNRKKVEPNKFLLEAAEESRVPVISKFVEAVNSVVDKGKNI